MPATETTTETSPKRRFRCRHIHAAGHRCGSPALRGENFCYYHHTARPAPAPDPALPAYPEDPHAPFTLPLLEDRTAIQLALGQVLNRIALNQLDHRRAGLLLYGLQIAAQNLPREPRPTTNKSTTSPTPSADQDPPDLIEDLTPEPNPEDPDPAQDSVSGTASSRPTGPQESVIPTQPSVIPTEGGTAAAVEGPPHWPSPFYPLAPIAEILPETQPLSWAEQVIAELRRPRTLCTQCKNALNEPILNYPNPDFNPTLPPPEDIPPFDLSAIPPLD